MLFELQGRPLASLVLAGSLLALTACGSSVTFFDDNAGGAGGIGGSGASGLTGPGGGDPCSPAESCNPAQCPSEMPSGWDDCQPDGLSCAYQEGDCVRTFECQWGEDCWTDGSGGIGDGGGCQSWTKWQDAGQTCSGPVACDVAQDGDPCAVPGDSCGEGFECEGTDKVCGDDLKWHVSYYSYDDCCYDQCCYEGPYYCPEVLPEPYTWCDPCFDGPQCDYQIETECGLQSVTAYCDDIDWTWLISPIEPCAEPQ